MGALVAVLLASLLAGCAARGYPTSGLTHAINGPFHVLLGAPNVVDDACRAVGVDTAGGQRVLGCFLRAGNAYFMWAAEDLDLAETIAHEWRHSHEGRWHP